MGTLAITQVDNTLSLKFNAFEKIQVLLPVLPKQQRIAQFIQECDHEINLLERRLNALKKHKSDLMHRLLTGEVRVTVDESESSAASAVGVQYP